MDKKTQILVSVNDQVMKITEAPTVASGGINEVEVCFGFCQMWEGYKKTAIFYRDEDNAYFAELDENDVCVVPWEVCYEKGIFYFGVFGVNIDGARKTAVTAKYKVKAGAISEALKPSDPTPDIYDQIMAKLAENRELQKTFIAEATEVTNSAKEAAGAANTAARNANDAASASNRAAENANTAAVNAEAGADNANQAAAGAVEAAGLANQAVAAANAAAGSANAAAVETREAREAFLEDAQEALRTVHDTATADAPAIVCEAVGKTISVTDAANRPLEGLTLYGKTIQSGTPTPENPVELVSVGKSGSVKTTVCGRNLWAAAPLSPALDTTVDEDGYITITNNTTVKQCPGKNLKVPTGNYTIRVEVASNHIEGYVCKDTMDYSNQILSSKTVKLVNVTKICTQFAIVPNETIKFRITVNAGNTAFPYEPYKEPHTVTALTPNGLNGIPVASGGNYTDEQGQQWLCDEVDFARGVYVQRIETKQVTMPFDEDTNGIFRGKYAITNPISTYPALLCNRFMGAANYNDLSANDLRIGLNSSGTVLLNYKAFRGNASGLNEWAVNNPIYLSYPQKTPIETPLSAEELAQYAAARTHKPNTTVFNDSGADMALAYNADTKTYIDQKLAAISAAMLNA